MKVTIAIDSFKGSLTTFQSARAIEEGIKRVSTDAVIKAYPIADGGEGTVDAIISACFGEAKTVKICGPLGKITDASYGIVKSEGLAVIEMATAAGITLISSDEKNPLNTTTYGVGQLILDAIDNGCNKFIIGIGGSCTNDGGVGMLQALGFEFFDKTGKQVSLGAKGLKDIVRISVENADKRLEKCSFTVACDVKNPLCGANGCSAIYGKQKGADDEMIKNMDGWLESYSLLTKKIIPTSDKNALGAGAAGGLGFALMSYLNAELKSGIQLIMEQMKIEKDIIDSDIVITGEGRLDNQSCMGKVPVGVASLAKKYNKPVIAFSGAVTEGAEKCNDAGIDAYFPILRSPCTLQDAMNVENAYKNLADTVEQVFRLLKIKGV